MARAERVQRRRWGQGEGRQRRQGALRGLRRRAAQRQEGEGLRRPARRCHGRRAGAQLQLQGCFGLQERRERHGRHQCCRDLLQHHQPASPCPFPVRGSERRDSKEKLFSLLHETHRIKLTRHAEPLHTLSSKGVTRFDCSVQFFEAKVVCVKAMTFASSAEREGRAMCCLTYSVSRWYLVLHKAIQGRTPQLPGALTSTRRSATRPPARAAPAPAAAPRPARLAADIVEVSRTGSLKSIINKPSHTTRNSVIVMRSNLSQCSDTAREWTENSPPAPRAGLGSSSSPELPGSLRARPPRPLILLSAAGQPRSLAVLRSSVVRCSLLARLGGLLRFVVPLGCGAAGCEPQLHPPARQNMVPRPARSSLSDSSPSRTRPSCPRSGG